MARNFTLQEVEEIFEGLQQNLQIKAIADKLGRSVSGVKDFIGQSYGKPFWLVNLLIRENKLAIESLGVLMRHRANKAAQIRVKNILEVNNCSTERTIAIKSIDVQLQSLRERVARLESSHNSKPTLFSKRRNLRNIE